MITQNVKVNSKPWLRVVRLGRASNQAHVGLASLRACEEARRRDSSEHDRGNKAEETGQVRVNLHKSLDQKGSWANERARQPVLKAVSRESIGNSSPECRPRSKVQRVLVGNRKVLLGDSEDVQGEPAAQGNHELIHVGEPSQQHRRDEGVGTQEQESVAGVAFVVVGRGVVTAGPHGDSGESLKLNFTPHRPLRVPACAPTALVAALPPGLSGA